MLYLYESVSLLQAGPELPLLFVSVFSDVLPGSISLLLLHLFLPQLLPSVCELSRQRRHRLTVTALAILFKNKQNENSYQEKIVVHYIVFHFST